MQSEPTPRRSRPSTRFCCATAIVANITASFTVPTSLAMDYTRPVRWLNGKQAPPGCKAEISESEAYVKFVEENRAASPAFSPASWPCGTAIYTPIPLDENYGKTPEGKTSQAGMYGRLEIPAEFSRTAFTAQGRDRRPGAAQGRAVHADHFNRSAASAMRGFRALLQPVSARAAFPFRQASTIPAPTRPIPRTSASDDGAYRNPDEYPADDLHLLRDGHRGG